MKPSGPRSITSQAPRPDFRRVRPAEAAWRPVSVDRADERHHRRWLGREAVKITADTNILVRALTDDDAEQSPRAQAELAQAELVAIPPAALCELVWVLTRGYRLPAAN